MQKIFNPSKKEGREVSFMEEKGRKEGVVVRIYQSKERVEKGGRRGRIGMQLGGKKSLKAYI